MHRSDHGFLTRSSAHVVAPGVELLEPSIPCCSPRASTLRLVQLDAIGPGVGVNRRREEGMATGAARIVEDPVCGMRIDPEDAAATAEHGGTTYYFCSQTCYEAFVADPTAYV
jgi:YHS domain-containing protein